MKVSESTVYHRTCKRPRSQLDSTSRGPRGGHTHRCKEQPAVQVDEKILPLKRQDDRITRRYPYTAVDDLTRLRALLLLPFVAALFACSSGSSTADGGSEGGSSETGATVTAARGAARSLTRVPMASRALTSRGCLLTAASITAAGVLPPIHGRVYVITERASCVPMSTC